MLTTNQVPFIAQVSVIPYSMGYESAKYFIVFWKSLFYEMEKTFLKIIVAFHPKHEWILT